VVNLLNLERMANCLCFANCIDRLGLWIPVNSVRSQDAAILLPMGLNPSQLVVKVIVDLI
jgi:hypothetical protein